MYSSKHCSVEVEDHNFRDPTDRPGPSFPEALPPLLTPLHCFARPLHPPLLRLRPFSALKTMVKPGAVVTPGEALYQNPPPSSSSSSSSSSPSSPPTMKAGEGAYLSPTGTVRASVAGTLTLSPSASGGASVISVVSSRHSAVLASVIEVGTVVLGRVTRLTLQQATVEILALGASGSTVLKTPNSGVVRTEDVTSLASDTLSVPSAFRLGDVVVARVISLGDSRQYFLSTAEDGLGVVEAACGKSGVGMVPKTFRVMECPVTGEEETRKVCRPS